MSLMERIKSSVRDHTYTDAKTALWDLAKWGQYQSQKEFDADYFIIYGHPRTKIE